MAVKVLVIDAQFHAVSASTGAGASSRARPPTPTVAGPDPRTTAQAPPITPWRASSASNTG